MATVSCRDCGSAVGAGDKTCGFCGSALPRTRAVPAANPAAAGSAADGDPFARAISARLRLPTGRVITLEAGDRLVVGRGPDSPLADVCTDNISHDHAFFVVRDDGVYLQDTRSTNGTFVNGNRLEPCREYRLPGSSAVTFASDPPLRIGVEVSES